MGLDVYTPAYGRMTQTDEWRSNQQRDSAWSQRSTVREQRFTDADWTEYDEIAAVRHRLERSVGHFRFDTPFQSSLACMAAFTAGEAYAFELTHDEVGQHLKEWRTFLRTKFAKGEHLEIWANGRGERVPNPFENAVDSYKLWCQIFRLGEGCYVA